MSKNIGFIGLGALGQPIAANLLQTGYDLRVYNRTASKADALVSQGAQLAQRPADVITPGGIVATLVWDDAAVESVVMNEGFLEQLGQGGIHIGMSTIMPETSKKIAELHAQHGSAYVDAPIFGIPTAAAARQLWIPFSGSPQAKERIRPVLVDMGAQGIFDIGDEVGGGNMTKLIGNFLIGSTGYAMREALAIACMNGVDPKAVVNMLTNSLLPGYIFQNYGRRLTETNQPFVQSAIPLKDVGLLKKTAQEVDAPTPFANLLLEQLNRNAK